MFVIYALTGRLMEHAKSRTEMKIMSPASYRRLYCGYCCELLALLLFAFISVPQSGRSHVGRAFQSSPILVTGYLFVFAGVLIKNAAGTSRAALKLAQRVADMRRIAALALVTAIMSLVTLFAFSYWLQGYRDGSCFETRISKIDAVYFTVTTFSTTGFGDIQPVTQTCRAVVTAQMVSGFAVITVSVSFFLSKLSENIFSDEKG
jgi:hypothetical protein